jgi:hypothetical protein
MRNKGGREDDKCLGFSSHSGDRRSFFSEIGRHVSSTKPIQLNVAYSIGWSERKRKYNYSKMAAKLKYKRTPITTM